ncbi:hypothetical protein [Gandjariella thermophila]|uniref:DUF1542 domain-containing protein n=1 Tax=Gandjariella thermophila TaxID=1931992 RepID=A0A4D4J6J6_9PSEU|nr:hypothetical protein [Gandjariella thermophila]GDY32365.1 hypothetical protein GTS_39980 [Gandjariella thermophila]
MLTAVVLVLLIALVIGVVMWGMRRQAAAKQQDLEDARAEARRWIERLGGQVYNLDGASDPAAKQALADAGERYNAAGSQLDQAKTPAQCRLATQTAMEGLYYVRAARTALGMDPGPELPDLSGQNQAGRVTEDRKVTVEGHDYEASPRPGANTPHYYPGGVIAGRPVPQGWYSEPWWKPALIGGAWGVGAFLLADALFSGMHSVPMGGWDAGYAEGFSDAQHDMGGQGFGDFGGGGDAGGDGGWDIGDVFGGGDGDNWDLGGGGDFGGDW